MATETGKLKVAEIEKAKADTKLYRLFDGGGLYLEVRPNGGKYWRFKYQYNRTEKRITCGTYPEVSLADARLKRKEYRRLVAAGIDPSTAKKQAQEEAQKASQDNFEFWCGQYLKFLEKNKKVTPSYLKDVDRRLSLLYPAIGKTPVTGLTRTAIRDAIDKVLGHRPNSAKRLDSEAAKVLSLCMEKEILTANVMLGGTFKKAEFYPEEPKHHKSLKLFELGPFIRDFLALGVDEETVIGMLLIVHTAARTSEILKGRWSEIDFERKLWTIPNERMKMRRKTRDDFIIPLTPQVIALLRRLHQLTGHHELMFPGRNGHGISPTVIIHTINGMPGWKDKASMHGMRAVFSTAANEAGFNFAVIESCLAHAVKGVAGIYNHAQHLAERRKLLEWWSELIKSYSSTQVTESC